MFKTPALQEFWLTWYLQPSQLPFPLNNEEFLSERLIEDICDGKNSVACAILEVKVPDMQNHRVGQDVGVQFKILCTQDMARELIELGYKVQDRDEPDEDDGTTWQELLMLISHNTRSRTDTGQWEKPIRLTNDGDPHAPWFKVVGIKTDDDGPFIAIEEIQL